MLSLFSDMVEHFLEIFMDDFSIYEDSFDQCLHNLELVLKWCTQKNLTLNWEKYHFMVKRWIVLGHEIPRSGIEVHKAKIYVIAKLPESKFIQDIRSFLGHVRFYRRFIKELSKIVRTLTNLLEKDMPLFFDDGCLKAGARLKQEFFSAPIISAPDWTKPFEIMYDASDFWYRPYSRIVHW